MKNQVNSMGYKGTKLINMTFLLFFANCRVKLLYKGIAEVTAQHLSAVLAAYKQQFLNFSFQQYFSLLLVNLPLASGLYKSDSKQVSKKLVSLT